MTAAAFFHKKLPADLQRDLESTLKEAEAWAQTAYAPALAKRNALRDAERDAILEGLSRFTGLAVEHAGSQHARRRKGSVQDSTAPRRAADPRQL